MLVDWIEFDLGANWRKAEDKYLLADEIRIAFLELQNIFWKNKPPNFRYHDLIVHYFHEGNRDCGLILSKVSDIKRGASTHYEILWTILYRLFSYLQTAYCIMELTNLLKKGEK